MQEAAYMRNVAERYGVTLRTIWNWKRRGMPCQRVGNKHLHMIDYEEIEKWRLEHNKKGW